MAHVSGTGMRSRDAASTSSTTTSAEMRIAITTNRLRHTVMGAMTGGIRMSDIKTKHVDETTTLYSSINMPYDMKDDRESISHAERSLKRAIVDSILNRIELYEKDLIITAPTIRYIENDSLYSMDFKLRVSIDCKDVIYCENCELYSQELHFCRYTSRMVNANDYCSRARKRKEKE